MSDQDLSSESSVSSSQQSGNIVQSAHSLWTVKDVAQFLNLTPETIRMKARQNELPALKIGRVWRFSKDEIEKWLVNKMENIE